MRHLIETVVIIIEGIGGLPMGRKVISWLLVILWMALIFYLSHQPAMESNSLSTGIVERIIAVIDRVTFDIDIDTGYFNFFIRKSAHFFTYLILGMLVFNALTSSGMRGLRRFFIALAVCILFAVSDEVHQLFIPGRAGQVRDVMIDTAGAIVGVGGFLVVEKLILRVK